VLAYRCLVREDDREAPSFLFESVEQGSEGTNVVSSHGSLNA
jgi:anthranilate synthase component 1